MLLLGLLSACSPSVITLDAPSDAIDGAAGVIHADKVVEQWASARAATTLTRAEFTRVEGLKVSKGCVVAHAGVPVAAFLDEAACAEDAPTFAKRLDNAPVLADAVELATGSIEGKRLKETLDTTVQSLTGDGKVPQAVQADVAASKAVDVMKLAASGRGAGVQVDVWGCAKTYSTSRARLRRARLEAECANASTTPTDRDLVVQLERLANKRAEAVKVVEGGTRPTDSWSPAGSCAAMLATRADTFPFAHAGPLDGSQAIVVPALRGETLTASLSGMDADPVLEVYDAGCGDMLTRNDDYGYSRSSRVTFRVPASGLYVIVPKSLSGTGVGALSVTTDGEGGPSAEEVATAKSYLTWFDGSLAGATPEEIVATPEAALAKLTAARPLLEEIERGTRRGLSCVATSIATEDVLAYAFIDEATTACTAQAEAAIQSRLQIQVQGE